MGYDFLDLATTPAVRAAQEANGSGEYWANFKGDRSSDRFTAAEAAFIAERDSLYMATVSESGWPYVQHRGGPPGFIRVLDEKTLAIPDFRGNRQYISAGNLSADDRAALILMDYPHRRRLKIYAHVEARDLSADPELAAKLTPPDYRAKVERGLIIHLVAFDWNCPQHIMPRFQRGRACAGARAYPCAPRSARGRKSGVARETRRDREIARLIRRPRPEGRAKHGVSKDDSDGGNGRAVSNVLRDAPSALLEARGPKGEFERYKIPWPMSQRAGSISSYLRTP